MILEICHINLAKGFRGGERQTFLLVRQLAGKIRQTVILRKGSPLSKMLASLDKVKILEIDKPFFLNINRLKSFSLIHAHEAKAAHLAFFAKCLFKIPYIITRRVLKQPKNIFFFKKVHLNAVMVVAISNAVKKVLGNIDKRINTQVIFSSHSVPEVNLSETGRLADKYKDRFLIGHVGALVNKDKGQAHIIQVARRIAEKAPDIHFLFLGEGIDKEAFKRQAKGCDNIEFAGFKSNIGDYYTIFDLFLFPSLDEGLGSAVLDAFYFGLPVIATNVGGIPDMVQSGKTGILIPAGDEARMYDEIMALYQDTELCHELGRTAKESLRRFDIRYTAIQYLNLYTEFSSPQKKGSSE